MKARKKFKHNANCKKSVIKTKYRKKRERESKKKQVVRDEKAYTHKTG